MYKSLWKIPGALLLVAATVLFPVGCDSGSDATRGSSPAGAGSVASAPSLGPAATDTLIGRFQAALDASWAQAQDTDENFPGATAAFILPDGRAFGFATGKSDVDDDIPMTRDLLMPSGSIGKTYVAAVALQLSMTGEIDLDMPISTWLGDAAWFSRVPNHAELTLRNLLNHTAGMIQPYFEDPDFAARLAEVFSDPDDYMTPEQFIAESVLDTEPFFPAGEGFHYSDVHYTLAGLAIEAATGRPYYDLLDELFLEPLGLDLTLPADRRDLPHLAQGYAHASAQLFDTPLEIVENGQLVVHPLQEWTGGGVVNNPQALVRWAKLLYEGNAIDGDDLPELFRIGFPTDAANPHLGYGLGVSVAESEHGLTYGHGGFFPGYNSLVAYYADHEIAVAIQINSDDSRMGSHLPKLADAVIEALAASEPQATRQPTGPVRIVIGPDHLVSRDGDRPHVEIMVAANPRNPRNLLAGAITFTRRDGGSATKAYVSRDGGIVWDDVFFPEQREFGGADPQVAFTAAGTAIFLTLATAPDETGRTRAHLHSYRSEDEGGTWSDVYDLGSSYDHPMLVADQTDGPFAGRLYASVLYGTEYNLGVFRSEDDGRSWIGPVKFIDGEGRRGLNVDPMLVFRDGAIMAPFTDFPVTPEQMADSDGSRIWTVVSADGGVTFSEPKPGPVRMTADQLQGARDGADCSATIRMRRLRQTR